ncbi:hypothetical protein BD410DRAFT_390640 [Rickenella mellea]|uniref:Uncharacterized protein n=1 Tax=Rickenella mellea TaxID=50990 RepID=A0A4Y7PZK5_9AGAM|nr:hypothetical protein BD410DRAFT_390640 [Rickenella mellea]
MATEALPDSVLGAHRAPTDTQRATAHSIIKEKKQRLSELDIQIARLNVRREAISADIHRYQEFLSPAQWLIHELLAEIFIYCFPNA